MAPGGIYSGALVDDPEVRRYLRTLGHVTESSADEEQGPEHYVAVVSAGLELMSEEGIIQAVTLYGGARDGYARYAGSLPLGLTMELHRPDVRDLLGGPHFQIEASNDRYLGRIAPCDRYDGSDFSTALDYDEATEQVTRIELLLPAAVPR